MILRVDDLLSYRVDKTTPQLYSSSTLQLVSNMQKVILNDLGKISYRKAWDLQQELMAEVIDIKRIKRDAVVPTPQKHYFLYCEHPHVYTLGRSGSLDNLLLSEQELAEKSIEFYKINRGGDITYHGPGQIVGYTILDLDCFFTDIHRFVRYIEEAVIRTLVEYGVKGERIEGLSGVWLKADEKRPDRKICAIGIHLSRWVTMHGFAFNIQTDLAYFNYIVPCGITNKAVTSLEMELGKAVDLIEVKEKLNRHFAELFGFEFTS